MQIILATTLRAAQTRLSCECLTVGSTVHGGSPFQFGVFLSASLQTTMAVGCLRFAMGFIRRCRRALIVAAIVWAAYAMMLILEDSPKRARQGLHRAAQVRAEGFLVEPGQSESVSMAVGWVGTVSA